jgi:periplasmic divalent cation tolerance protein
MTDPPETAGAFPLRLVLTSEADPERAERLAAALVESGLVACASLHPVRSLYRWQGRLERSEEVQLLLKTSPERLAPLRRRLLELHSYDTPEWIVWAADTAGAYGLWCREQLGGGTLSGDAAPQAPGGSPGGVDPAG